MVLIVHGGGNGAQSPSAQSQKPTLNLPYINLPSIHSKPAFYQLSTCLTSTLNLPFFNSKPALLHQLSTCPTINPPTPLKEPYDPPNSFKGALRPPPFKGHRHDHPKSRRLQAVDPQVLEDGPRAVRATVHLGSVTS